jgi:predicted NBD/HSP70 family sugar kinase
MDDIGRNLSRGTNQSGGRIYNERLVLSLVRHRDGLPKAEIAKLTGLSAQTISVIMQQLEADHLIVKGEPQRGKVGQPRVPFSLNPNGSFSIGLKIGRHRSELALMDFVGQIRETRQISYAYPITTQLLSFVEKTSSDLINTLDPIYRDRLVGIGIATPFELWSWGDELGAPKDIMEAWLGFDIKTEVSQLSKLPAFIQNDATAACAAELTFGNHLKYDNYLYIYIGYFLGGGIVLNGSVFEGPTGNAGALGPMPVRQQSDQSSKSQQILHNTSKIALHRMISNAGGDPDIIWSNLSDWNEIGEVLTQWIDALSSDLAYAIVSAISIIDFPAIILDGDIPDSVRKLIVVSVRQKLELVDRQGLSKVTICEGSLGKDARVLGGASLPLLANFTRNRDVAFGG